MDICTASLAIFTNAVACLPPVSCHVEDGRKWCQPDWTVAVYCPSTYQQPWECVREDGTKYTITKTVTPDPRPQ